MNFEALLTDPAAFDLPASPAQRAIARIVDGQPLGELAERDDVALMCGGDAAVAALPSTPPTLVQVLAGVRCGKSLMSGARAYQLAATVDVTHVRSHGETPRVVIVSLSKDHAHATYEHLAGTVQAKPKLRALRVGKPTAHSLLIRQPETGQCVEILVCALEDAGGSVVSRWLAGLVVDEHPRMPFDGVRRVQDVVTAARGRLLPGGQILCIGSPWQPSGPAYENYVGAFGRPTADLVVLRGRGPSLNPSWWTPERVAKLRSSDPHAFRTDVESEFVDGETSHLDPLWIERATRPAGELFLTPPGRPIACGDLATRSNGCTLAIGWREQDGLDGTPRFAVGFAHEWRGTSAEPLKLGDLFAAWRKILFRYAINNVHVDSWSFDAANELASKAGVQLVEMKSEDRTEMHAALETVAREGTLSLPPIAAVSRDLVSSRKKAIPTGWKVELPKTPDGRHCDFYPSIALCARLTSLQPPIKILNEYERHFEARAQEERAKALAGAVFGGGGGYGFGFRKQAAVEWFRSAYSNFEALLAS